MTLLTGESIDKDLFTFEYHKGDEDYRTTIWINHWWFGKYYLHGIFF